MTERSDALLWLKKKVLRNFICQDEEEPVYDPHYFSKKNNEYFVQEENTLFTD